MATSKVWRMATMIGMLIVLGWAAGATAQEPALVLDGGIQFADGTVQTSALIGFAPVEDTGQDRCWDEEGTEIACSGTGQDGELQSGADWPTPRFVDNFDGTILDRLTGLIWLRDADCFGATTWATALSSANNLMDGQCELSDGSQATDWRLPNLKEMAALIDFGESAPAISGGHPFVDVRIDNFYWTSTSAAEDPSAAWGVGLNSGNSDFGPKDSPFTLFYAWPVRAGQ